MLGSVSYELIDGLLARANLSYDEAFETKVSADINVRFFGSNKTAQKKNVSELP